MKDKLILTERVIDAYPHLVRISCQTCKIDCNVCQHCSLKLFLRCDFTPQKCALKHNIIVSRTKGQ